jgi:hypothetical protein
VVCRVTTIGPSGSSRLSNSTKPDPSASKPETEETLESSEGSSSEVNSPVSLEKTSIAEGDETQENFNSEEKACQTHSNAKDFAVGSSSVSKVYQLCVIITEAEEGNNSEGTKKVDRQVNKVKDHNKKEKEKVHVSAGEWRMIKSAINHGTEVPEGSRREVLIGYQYALYQHKKKLREERDMVFQDNNSNTGKIIVKIQNIAERGAEIQNIEGGNSMRQRRRVLEEPHPTARRGGRGPDTKNARGSIGSSTSVSASCKTRTWRPARRYAPSRDTKPWNSRR